MAESYTRRCWKVFTSELHYSKLCFFHHDWKAFTYTPLLPYEWRYRVIYVVYRWIPVLPFWVMLIISWARATNPDDYFKHLGNWAFALFNLYVNVAAISTTTNYVLAHAPCRQNQQESREGEGEMSGENTPSGCCGRGSNKLSWYQVLQWVLFTLGMESSLAVSILYWALIYRGGDVTGLSLHTHLLNAVLAIADLWVSGIPINLLHGVYLTLFGAVYAAFAVIYFLVTGTNIYRPIADFSTKPAAAVFVMLGLVFVFLPLLHTVCFYLHSLARDWVLQYCCRRRGRDQEEARPEAKEGDVEL